MFESRVLRGDFEQAATAGQKTINNNTNVDHVFPCSNSFWQLLLGFLLYVPRLFQSYLYLTSSRRNVHWDKVASNEHGLIDFHASTISTHQKSGYRNGPLYFLCDAGWMDGGSWKDGPRVLCWSPCLRGMQYYLKLGSHLYLAEDCNAQGTSEQNRTIEEEVNEHASSTTSYCSETYGVLFCYFFPLEKIFWSMKRH